MAPRVLTISDVRVANLSAQLEGQQQAPYCSFELGMARVSTGTVRSPDSSGMVFGRQSMLYIAFDPHAQGAAHLRVHLYAQSHLRHDGLVGVGSVSLVAAVQAGAVSVHLLDPFGQDAADVEFVVSSEAPNEAAAGIAVSHGQALPLQAADSTSAAVLPGAEVNTAMAAQQMDMGQQAAAARQNGGFKVAPTLHIPHQADDTHTPLPVTPPNQPNGVHAPSSSSGTPRSDNGEVPVQYVTGNRTTSARTNDTFERGVFQNGTRVPTFVNGYGNSRNVMEGASKDDPWARSMTERARQAAQGAISNVRSHLDQARITAPQRVNGQGFPPSQ